MNKLTGFNREAFLDYCLKYANTQSEGYKQRIERDLTSSYGKDVASLVLDVLDKFDFYIQGREEQVRRAEGELEEREVELISQRTIYREQRNNLIILLKQIEGISSDAKDLLDKDQELMPYQCTKQS